MRILIICTYFPPDSTIGAVRPFMFAKYLSKAGHDVTVIRSGELECIPDNTLDDSTESFTVISYLGKDSQAERYKRGQSIDGQELQKARKLYWMPESAREIIRKVSKPITGITRIWKAKKKYPYLVKIIDELKNTESFDCVFSTYGNLENIWGGMYAADVLKTKLIMDFRDSIVWHHEKVEVAWNIYAKHTQKKVLKKAEVITCISEGLKKQLGSAEPNARILTISNGYEEISSAQRDLSQEVNEQLTFCLLGKVYEKGDEHALEILAEALEKLVLEKSIELEKIRFVYAGRDDARVERILKKYNIECILDCRGYVKKEIAYQIQKESDIFLVLSWNTKESQGIIGGKFYEGIRAEKPILVVVSGEEPNSELKQIYNKYKYGFCFEESMKENEYKGFLDCLKQYYIIKQKTGIIPYTQAPEFKEKFRYENLTKELEEIMISLSDKGKSERRKAE